MWQFIVGVVTGVALTVGVIYVFLKYFMVVQ